MAYIILAPIKFVEVSNIVGCSVHERILAPRKCIRQDGHQTVHERAPNCTK